MNQETEREKEKGERGEEEEREKDKEGEKRGSKQPPPKNLSSFLAVGAPLLRAYFQKKLRLRRASRSGPHATHSGPRAEAQRSRLIADIHSGDALPEVLPDVHP